MLERTSRARKKSYVKETQEWSTQLQKHFSIQLGASDHTCKPQVWVHHGQED